MAIEFRNDLFKVVNRPINRSRYNSYDQPTGTLESALLHGSRAKVNYVAGSDSFQPVRVKDTPFLLFDDAAAAFEFAGKFPNRVVYAVEAYGEVIPATQVLKIKYRGWDATLEQFWADVKAGNPLTGYTTITAQPHSVALFGVMRLSGLAVLPPKDVPAPDPEIALA